QPGSVPAPRRNQHRAYADDATAAVSRPLQHPVAALHDFHDGGSSGARLGLGERSLAWPQFLHSETGCAGTGPKQPFRPRPRPAPRVYAGLSGRDPDGVLPDPVSDHDDGSLPALSLRARHGADPDCFWSGRARVAVAADRAGLARVDSATGAVAGDRAEPRV